MTNITRTSRLLSLAVTAIALVAAGGLTTEVSASTGNRSAALTFVRKGHIYTSTLSGEKIRRLTWHGVNLRPHWSPDGKRIAFVRKSRSGLRDIWVMNADGTHKQRVTRLGDTTEPTWSPDGRWLAFGGDGTPPYDDAGQSLRTVSSTAPFGDPVALTGMDPEDPGDDPKVVDSLAWSPDGTQIAYYSDSFPSSPDHFLLVYSLGTGAIDFVTGIGGSCCGEGFLNDPTWTPDSTALAYTELRYFPPDEPAPTGSHITLTEWPTRTPLAFATVEGDADPDYSASGDRVVLNHRNRVVVAAADGSGRVTVTRGHQPDWRPGVG